MWPPNSKLNLVFQGGSSYYYNRIGAGGYSFAWNVQDAYNDFGHREDRGLGKSGIDETRGSYHVQLPDGRVQTVTYFVDPYNGYQVKQLIQRQNRILFNPTIFALKHFKRQIGLCLFCQYFLSYPILGMRNIFRIVLLSVLSIFQKL